MTPTLKNVAMAICEATGTCICKRDNRSPADSSGNSCRRSILEARAALTALQTLPHELLQDGAIYVGYHTEQEGGASQDINHAWQHIIDEILNE